MKNNRLFGIIYLLLSKDKMTSKELADYFEVSVRTIYRDIETLSELNIPIYMSKGKNGGIKLLDNYKFDKTLLTEEEQREILFSLEGINKIQIDNKNIYDKLSNIFSNNDENWFEVDFSVWDNSNSHKKTFETIKKAIINKNVLKFSYFSSYGTNTLRKVEPLKLYFRYNSWYLCAFDIAKNDYRFFKLMRIKDLKTLDEKFERAININLHYEDKIPKLVKLILEIDKSLAYRVYDEFSEENIEILDNGNFKVTTEFPFNDWVYGYILSFGENIKVLEPLYIKEEIINRLKKSIENYL